DPERDGACEIRAQKIGFSFCAKAATEGQHIVRVQGKSQHADHHAFLRLGWMTCHGERMVGVIVPIHVRHLQLRLVNRRRQSHEAVYASPSAMRSMRRSGSAAPHSSWSPTVKALRYS